MKKILIIIPYFGPLPNIFLFWYQSAIKNPTINFLIFSDSSIEQAENIKVIKTSFSDFSELIQCRFDFRISLPSPYKLCDFKGAYGYIFEEYISGYDFWGFGDIDVVYGDLRHFFSDKILEKYWVISGWGHLTLYKNSGICNNFFKTKIEGFNYYETVFSSPQKFVFDEFNHRGMGEMWLEQYPEKLWNSLLFDDIRVPRLSFNFVSEFHPEFSHHLIFEYINKKLYRVYLSKEETIVREETLYAHFQQRNFMKIGTSSFEKYLIVPNSFIPIEEVTISKLKKWTKPNIFKKNIYNLKNKFNRRFNEILKSI